jgi:DNA-binding transcriptional regulator PaaX
MLAIVKRFRDGIQSDHLRVKLPRLRKVGDKDGEMIESQVRFTLGQQARVEANQNNRNQQGEFIFHFYWD